ncbi:hypothetical protein FQR65_LT18178 [Abscondita terminalis]|nr:hypothetical protein FQR65_LT18178 [Abscondita terminalis]
MPTRDSNIFKIATCKEYLATALEGHRQHYWSTPAESHNAETTRRLETWHDMRSRTKLKEGNNRRYARGTGGGPPKVEPLTDIEEDILTVIKTVLIEGHAIEEAEVVEIDTQKKLVAALTSDDRVEVEEEINYQSIEIKWHLYSRKLLEELLEDNMDFKAIGVVINNVAEPLNIAHARNVPTYNVGYHENIIPQYTISDLKTILDCGE